MAERAQDGCLAPTIGPLAESPREALDRLARLGFRSVQLPAGRPPLRPRDLDRSARRDLLIRLRRLSISPAGLDLWIPAVHLADPARTDRAAAAVVETLRLAADLGRCPVSLALPPGEEAGAALESIARESLRCGVAVADHAAPATARDGFAVGIDPPAWLAHGLDPVAAVGEHAARLAAARLSDLSGSGQRGPVSGGGRLDVAAYRRALDEADYHGPVVIDARSWPDPWSGLEQTADAWAAARPARSR